MGIKKLSIVLITVVIALVALYGLFIIYINWPIDSFSVEKSGVFGDSFGLLTSLFSGLAFVGIIITILLQREELQYQREELKLQREEIRENRKELARTASAQEKSEESFAYQASLMALSALSNLTDLKMRAGEGYDRVLIDKLYKDLISKLDKKKE